jgi:hypothetical protein
MRIGVSGTPLVVQNERVLVKGLRGRTWRTNVEFGQLPVGIQLEKTFYVFNTGGLDMKLAWQLMRFQDERDCDRPDSQIFDVKVKVDAALIEEERAPATHLRRRSVRADSMTSAISFSLLPEDVVREKGLGASGDSFAAGVEDGGPWREEDGTRRKHEVAEKMPMIEGTVGELTEAEDSATSSGPLKLVLEPHAAPDTKPFVVEPTEKVWVVQMQKCESVTEGENSFFRDSIFLILVICEAQ